MHKWRNIHVLDGEDEDRLRLGHHCIEKFRRMKWSCYYDYWITAHLPIFRCEITRSYALPAVYGLVTSLRDYFLSLSRFLRRLLLLGFGIRHTRIYVYKLICDIAFDQIIIIESFESEIFYMRVRTCAHHIVAVFWLFIFLFFISVNFFYFWLAVASFSGNIFKSLVFIIQMATNSPPSPYSTFSFLPAVFWPPLACAKYRNRKIEWKTNETTSAFCDAQK